MHQRKDELLYYWHSALQGCYQSVSDYITYWENLKDEISIANIERCVLS
jgi:hypothetical protein